MYEEHHMAKGTGTTCHVTLPFPTADVLIVASPRTDTAVRITFRFSTHVTTHKTAVVT